jgi:hypothetical protein
MATSPNYAWAEPDNSSLVKNGAADIRTLGDAIDTSVWNIGFGQAGKNKIINGDFGIWQRGTSGFALGGAYNADRFAFYTGTSTNKAVTQQTFTPGTAPVAGYESQFFWRFAESVATVADTNVFYQKVENVRSFAGQTVTLSFYAKSTTTSSTITPQLSQVFGGGGSATVDNTGSAISLTTSWARYSATFSLASISGKTIGTSSYVEADLKLKTNLIQTVDIWGVQLEYGSKATPFQTASGGSPQAELAMCQRYYSRFGGLAVYQNFGQGYADQTTTAIIQVPLPVTMRVVPTSIDFSTLNLTTGGTNTAVTNCTFLGNNSSNQIAVAYATVAAGLTVNRPYGLTANNSTSGYLGFSAEL